MGTGATTKTEGEIMTLKDADALMREIKQLKIEPDASQMIWSEDVLDIIQEAPEIPAIPMGWMDEKIHGYAARLQSTELKALLIVKKLWEEDAK